MNIIFRFLLTLNSTSLLLIIFLIKEKYVLWQGVSEYLSYIVYVISPILMTYLSILLSPVEVPEMQSAAKRIIERLRCDAEQFQGLLISVGEQETIL